MRKEEYRPTLCWTCAKACGKCSWSKKFKKVKGWTAKKTIIKGDPAGLDPEIKSYLVLKCPLYEKEHFKEQHIVKVSNKVVTEWLGINTRTYFRTTTRKEREQNKQRYIDEVLNKKKKVV